jgi:hypothetical protein
VAKPEKPKRSPLPFVKEMLKVHLHDELAQEGCRTVLQFMAPIYEDGVLTRLPGSIRITVDSGAYIVQIDLPTEDAEVTCRVDSLIGIMESVQKAIDEGKAIMTEGWKKKKRDRQRVSDSVD